jgi:hypothetical protein
MDPQSGLLRKPFSAGLTLVGFFARMSSLVNTEVGRSRKVLSALCTLMRSLLSVNGGDVHLQVILLLEDFRAGVAGKPTAARVSKERNEPSSVLRVLHSE